MGTVVSALKTTIFTRRRLRQFAGLVLSSVVVLTVARYWPRAPLAEKFSSSVAVYDANGRLLRLTLSDDDKYRLWTPLREIAPTLVDATLLHEDRHFFRHPGVNPLALGRGAWRTYLTDERRQGGSTITMQLARLKYQLNSRTVTGKLKQIARAIELEICYSKNDILEAYLNLVPYGANIEGVGAGSLIYFGKRAEKLTLPESLALTVIPQSPARRGLGRASQNADMKALTQARAALFKEWAAAHPEDESKAAQFATTFRLGGVEQLPFHAPHAVEALLAQPRAARTNEIRAALDLKQQRLLERHIRSYVSAQSRVGIRNATAMLLNYETMEVKALVGSADFFNGEIDGQVNGTQAKRSPGSTLKPFVYALGIDQGVLHPATVLRDAPSSFGPFSPENFDGQFAGPIAAKDALIKSRNIPAVQIAAKINKPGLYDFLRQGGVTRMKPESHYGLALVLGGGEVTMEELVTLYATLANGGELKPIQYLGTAKDTGRANGMRLLSEEASYITLDMLKDNPRPNESFLAAKKLPVAWKTGTSYGFRDAWSVGVFGPYVLAVWVGNFDGQSNPALVGVQTAAPLFFQLIDAISAEQRDLREPARGLPARLTKIDVCTASGELPNAACPQKSATWFIPGVSPIKVSTLHRKLAIDKRSGLEACAPWREEDVRYDTYEYWSSDMQKLFREAGMPRRLPPGLMPQCRDSLAQTFAQSSGSVPKITSPIRGVTYTLRPAKADAESVNLQAVTDADAHEVFWFADQTFIGRAKPGGALAWKPPASGSYTLRAVDDHGRADSRELRVAVVQ
jgi:penicillin-binding protein 1C